MMINLEVRFIEQRNIILEIIVKYSQNNWGSKLTKADWELVCFVQLLRASVSQGSSYLRLECSVRAAGENVNKRVVSAALPGFL